MRVIERPKVADKNDPRYFSLKTRGVSARKVKAADGKTERYIIEGIASSSVIDRYGDLLTEQCQASMLAQALGLTMWLNHSYNVPEDIAGTCVEATLEHAAADDGTSCLDLKITLEIDPTNPRSLKCWESVANTGTKLAFSIGGYFIDCELVYNDEEDWYGHWVVDDVELLEISLVGIPANPRAYTKTFEKMREAVVARAEDIVREARLTTTVEKRIAIRKSFGLSEPTAQEGDNMDPCMKCVALANGQKCEEHRAAPTVPARKGIGDATGCKGCVMPTKETPDPEVVEGVHDPACDKYEAPAVEIKTIADSAQQSQIVECMKSIAKCINCGPAHALCAEPVTHAKIAHAMLKSMLPSDYEFPPDSEIEPLDAPEPTVRVAIEADTAALEAKLAQLSETLTDLNSQHETLSSDVESLTTAKTALEQQKADLETQIAELKATPLGRRTKSTVGKPVGSSKGSESTVPASAYYK